LAGPPTLTAQDWLDVWDEAASLPAQLRSLELLRPACVALAAAELADLPLGTCDSLLLDLRSALFGSRLACTAECPGCGERCEWSCEVNSLRAATDRVDVAQRELELSRDGWRVRFRPVSCRDLAALGNARDESAAVRHLLERCVSEALYEGRSTIPGDLPDALVTEISAALSAADPRAIAVIALTCPRCAHHWNADFDPGAFLWAELDAWAQRTLGDVHQLATHYGWSEPEILALAPARRARYLALVSA